jgi:ribosome biogenesis GTPase
MSLLEWGWSSFWAERFAASAPSGLQPARVVGVSRGEYALEMQAGRTRGELSGRLEYAAETALDLPAAGDWVAVTATDPALIIAVVERQSIFSRVIESGERQALAANVDIAFIVCGLDGDFNIRRIERYLVLAREAGVEPVIVLNKRDVCADPTGALQAVSSLGRAVLVSALLDDVPSLLGGLVAPGQTAALLGSSGVGKSTLVNALLGAAVQETFAVREDDSRGRHTTTSRVLFRMPGDWLLVDMPGLRAVGIGSSAAAIADAFEDVVELAMQCRFQDCTHTGEPDCAVVQQLDPARLESYHKLQREAAYQHRREDATAARAEKERWKAIHRAFNKRADKRT